MTANPWLKSSPCLSSPLCIIEPIINMAKFAMSAAVVMAIFCSHLFGQSGAASIQGKVTDSTGAVVVGVSVSILNQETGLAVEAKTSSVGFYQVPSLFTGRYIYPTPIREAIAT
jgi:Carboxypeptidase regulatory-like domain